MRHPPPGSARTTRSWRVGSFGGLLAGLDVSDHISTGTPVVFMIWFVVLQHTGMALILAFPQLALWLPRFAGFLSRQPPAQKPFPAAPSPR